MRFVRLSPHVVLYEPGGPGAAADRVPEWHLGRTGRQIGRALLPPLFGSDN